MRLKDTKTVKAMIDRMNAQGGTEVVANPELVGDEAELTGLEVAGTKYKVEGSGVPSMLELNTVLTGTLPIDETIEDAEDIAKLEAIKTDFTQNQKMPPLFFKAGAFNSSEDASFKVAPLSEVDWNSGEYTMTYVCSTDPYTDLIYYVIYTDNGDWKIGEVNHEE